MPIGHGGNDGLFVFEVTIDQTDTYSGLGADVVHAGLMKTAFSEAVHGGGKDLLTPVSNGIGAVQGG
jgi:hypothetical protein